MAPFDQAADELYGVPLHAFVAERKRLAAELKASDKAAAGALAKLPRPSQSAWAVNQLFRGERAAWQRLLELTQQARTGSAEATAQHRDAVSALVDRAEALLKAEGQAASELVLRRVATNLRAVATTGWGEAAPGRLVDDLDEPGFGALGLPEAGQAPEPAPERSTAAPAAERSARLKAGVNDDREAEPREPPSRPSAARQAEEDRARREGAAAHAALLERLEHELEEHERKVTIARERLDESSATLEALGKMLADAEAQHAHLDQRLAEEKRELAQATLRLSAARDRA